MKERKIVLGIPSNPCQPPLWVTRMEDCSGVCGEGHMVQLSNGRIFTVWDSQQIVSVKKGHVISRTEEYVLLHHWHKHWGETSEE